MRAEAGIALIVVLPVLALLLTIVAEFTYNMRIEALTMANFRATVSEGWLAEAGYQRAVAEMLPETVAHELDKEGHLAFRRERLGSPPVPQRIDVPLGAGRFSYRITDESARLNLNRLTPVLLDRVLLELAVERTDRDVIVDSVQDWRDANEDHRLNGAESDYYLALPTPYRSKNADFDDVDELLQVRGVTRELLRGRPGTPGLAEYLTLAGTGALNVNTVSPVVLRVLGFAEAEVEVLVARRPYTDLGQLPPALRRGAQQTRSDTFRVEAWAGGPEPAGRVLTAVVQRTVDRAGQPNVVPISWRWSDRPRRPLPAAAPTSGSAGS